MILEDIILAVFGVFVLFILLGVVPAFIINGKSKSRTYYNDEYDDYDSLGDYE